MPNIVTVNVSQTVAPTPSTLQKFGALISQGGTTTSQYTGTLLTQLSDLTSHLAAAASVTSAVLAAGTVTVTTTAPHGFASGADVYLTMAGFVPTAYNGTFLCNITGTDTFTYELVATPGVVTTEGTYVNASVAELTAMATTFFAQGSSQAIYVLELGAGSPADGVAALSSYITSNPNSNYRPGDTAYFYRYYVPRSWDAVPSFLTLLASYNALDARTYFHVTTKLSTYSNYTTLDKCVVATIESPAMGVWGANAITAATYSSGKVTMTTTTAHGVAQGQWFQISGMTPAGYNGWWQAAEGTTGSTLIFNVYGSLAAESVLGTLVPSYYSNVGSTSTEHSGASLLHVLLNYAPSTTNKVTPTAFSYVYGVTQFPTKGLSALLTTLKAAFVNIIGTGAEGGISNTVILWGTTMDGNDCTYWYCADWAAINCDLDISNAIINGSNNPINPLYYNQPGIDRLQAVAASTIARGVTFGLILGLPVQTALDGPELTANLAAGKYIGQSVVNAVPFLTYSAENPSDYKIGEYDGLAIAIVPARGFIHIVLNLNVSQFVAA